jgi:signal transduction histidine kinase
MTPDKLLEAIPLGAVLLAPLRETDGAVEDFVATACNDLACRWLRQPRDKIIGQRMSERMCGGADAARMDLARRTRRDGSQTCFRVAMSGEDAVALECWLSPVDDGLLLTLKPLSGVDAAKGDDDLVLVPLAADLADVGVWEYWPIENRVRWSAATRRIYGVPAGYGDGTFEDFRRLVVPEQQAKLAAADATLRRCGALEHDWLIQTPGGRRRWIHSRTRIVAFDAEGRPLKVLGVTFDVTESKTLHAELEKNRLDAERESEAKGRFLATMSHEIRTPLNGLLGMAELLERSLTEPAHRRMISVIRDTGSTVLTIINDILDHARIEAGAIALESVPLSPLEIAHRVEAAHLATTADKGLALRIEADPGAAQPRAGDPHRLTQILHNLIGNALKFTDRGGVTVRVRAGPGEPVTFEVEDTGIGMTDAQRARVFGRFEQAEDATARRFGGSGLGLSIVKGLVEAMGGTVVASSTPGVGSVFRVELPLAPVAATPIADRPAQALRSLRGLRVLAADDNEINRLVLTQMLDALGAQALIAASGVELLEARTSESFDVILLDIAMPGLDGPATLASLRRLEREQGLSSPPALAFTANVMPEQLTRYQAQGFSGHLAKPVTMSALAQALSAHGGGKAA